MRNVKEPLEIVGDRVLLRSPSQEHLHSLLQFYLTNRTFFERHQPERSDAFYTEAHLRTYIDEQRQLIRDGKGCLFLVFLKDQDWFVIGTVNFFNIIRGGFQACYLGFQIDEAHQGKGLMFESLTLGIHHVFAELNLHRVMANVRPGNTSAVRLLRKLGFEFEGHAKAYLRVAGKWVAYDNTALTNHQWTEPSE